jgi:HlyD family secretion protein
VIPTDPRRPAVRPYRVLPVNRPLRGVAALAATALLIACGEKAPEMAPLQTAKVERRNIVVAAEATGKIEPINIVEIKSRASGQIIDMPVETGTVVRSGDLIVQLDTRDVQNQFDQAKADLDAAKARLDVAEASRKRSEELLAAKVITTQEFESATLEYANSATQVIRAETNLDLAKQRLEDATVRAPGAGVVIEKLVALGTVILSATNSAGGGTTLVKMADLSQVRARVLITETDIGQIAPGLEATVQVDAYPNRPFRGTVEKIEPQAVVEQNVTMFPILVSLPNEDGALKPGMNGEVSILVDTREDVIAVPLDAVRTAREAEPLAPMFGLTADDVKAAVARGVPTRGERPADSAAGVTVSQGVLAEQGGQAGAAQGGAARGGQGGPSARGGQGGPPGGAAPAVAQGAPGATGAAPSGRNGGLGVTGRARARQGVVFVVTGVDSTDKKNPKTTFEPRLVMLGLQNYDYTEVTSGLKEGEEIALLSAAAMQVARNLQNEQARARMGGGSPIPGGGGGAAPAGGRGGQGGGGGGGGGRGGQP